MNLEMGLAENSGAWVTSTAGDCVASQCSSAGTVTTWPMGASGKPPMIEKCDGWTPSGGGLMPWAGMDESVSQNKKGGGGETAATYQSSRISIVDLIVNNAEKTKKPLNSGA
ncbi:MAG: hypothetical protein IPJ50_01135 [Betaproteobacteria bacterium]|nr:hypothetical protein [Betaproteobacteria bacterium]